MKLGSETDQEKWDEHWLGFQNLVPNLQEREQIITKLYKRNNVAGIRVRLQQQLVSLCHQLEATPELEKPVKQKKFQCERCESNFDTEKAKEQHFEAVHQYSICSKVFNTFPAKQQHEKDSHGKNK